MAEAKPGHERPTKHDEPEHEWPDGAPPDGEETAKAEESHHPNIGVTYAVIHKAGVSELERGSTALAWSGLAAGLSMGFSLLSQALIKAHLPDTPSSRLLIALGYTVGFLVVILGTQQLFTENTLTAVLPVLRRKRKHTLRNMLRLWGVVLLANLVGAFLFAAVLQVDGLFSRVVTHALDRIAAEAMQPTWSQKLLQGIFAGWLIAVMVWMMPAAQTLGAAVIIITTYFVGLGNFPHVIAGAVDSFYYGLGGGGIGRAVLDYILPALIGNTIGGTALVAGLAHAQVVGSGEG